MSGETGINIFKCLRAINKIFSVLELALNTDQMDVISRQMNMFLFCISRLEVFTVVEVRQTSAHPRSLQAIFYITFYIGIVFAFKLLESIHSYNFLGGMAR